MKRGYKIVSGGTDNHLFLVDLIDKNITGKDADAALGRAHITVNKNAVPNDPRPPIVTSGLRIGTPAATTRGFKEAEVIELAGWIADVLDANGSDEAVDRRRARQVQEICRRFPVYGRDELTVTARPASITDHRHVACTVRSAITRKRRSSIRGSRARASRFAVAASA